MHRSGLIYIDYMLERPEKPARYKVGQLDSRKRGAHPLNTDSAATYGDLLYCCMCWAISPSGQLAAY